MNVRSRQCPNVHPARTFIAPVSLKYLNKVPSQDLTSWGFRIGTSLELKTRMSDNLSTRSVSDPAAAKSPLVPDAVYSALREAIITLIHPPGTVLTEKAISSRYGVARPTARVAIQRLADEGLLSRDAHRSARVRRLSREDIHDLYGARVLIEEAASRLVAGNAIVAAAALDAQSRLSHYAQTNNLAPFSREDIGFHRALVTSSASSHLIRMHDLIIGEVELCMGQLQYHHILLADEIAREHQGLIDAIKIGDVDLAAARTRAHILNARNKLLNRYDLVEGTDILGNAGE